MMSLQGWLQRAFWSVDSSGIPLHSAVDPVSSSKPGASPPISVDAYRSKQSLCTARCNDKRLCGVKSNHMRNLFHYLKMVPNLHVISITNVGRNVFDFATH